MTQVRRYTAVVAVVLVLVWMVAFRWEWSFIDDPGIKQTLNSFTGDSGIVGIWHQIDARQSFDHSWGLFRPLYYVYTAVFYLANPAVAHGLRLAMFLAAILIPALRFGRYPLAALVAGAVLATNVSLYLGLSYMSLQELSGIALVALGLLSDGPMRRSLLWLGAAWLKSPFIWLFLAWSILLVFQRKKWAWLNIAVGIGTLALAATAARQGTYTKSFGLGNVAAAIKTALPLFGWPGVVGLAGVAAIRPKWRTLAWRDPLAWVFLAGGALYLANLLPWGAAGSYYGAPAVWMMSVGVLVILLPAERATFRMAEPVTITATVIALTGSLYVVQNMTGEQLDRNAAVVGVRDWIKTLPPEATIGINASEGALRLTQILTLNGTPHPVTFIDPSDTSTLPNYYVFFHDQGNSNERLRQNVVRPFASATVYAPG